MKPIKYELNIHMQALSTALLRQQHESVEHALHIKDNYLFEKLHKIFFGDVCTLTVSRLSIENEINNN